jgi:hypothetical protein
VWFNILSPWGLTVLLKQSISYFMDLAKPGTDIAVNERPTSQLGGAFLEDGILTKADRPLQVYQNYSLQFMKDENSGAMARFYARANSKILS